MGLQSACKRPQEDSFDSNLGHLNRDGFNESYYQNNKQSGDRLALVWYSKLFKKFIAQRGPVLDFGAGTGHLVKRLPQPNFAFEVNEFAFSQICQNSKETKCFLRISDLSRINDVVRGIVSIHVVEHMTDIEIESMFDCFDRISASDVRIMISTPALDGWAHKMKKSEWSAFSDPTHINLKTNEEWKKIFDLSSIN